MKRLLISITLLLSAVPMYSMEEVLRGMFVNRTGTGEGAKKSNQEIRKVVYAVEKDGVITLVLRKGDFSCDIKNVRIEVVGEKENVLSLKVD